ncbi:MAG: hypothetical protein ACM3RP_04690 [Chitinophagales bacterium]
MNVCRRFGIPARLVCTTKGRFPGKMVHGVQEGATVSGHLWLRVALGGKRRTWTRPIPLTRPAAHA